jgi:hypothetical protein
MLNVAGGVKMVNFFLKYGEDPIPLGWVLTCTNSETGAGYWQEPVGLTLPYAGSASVSEPWAALDVTNTGTGMAIAAETTSGTVAVRGLATDTGAVISYGGYFEAYGSAGRAVAGAVSGPEGRAVYGYAASTSGANYGVYGETESPDGVGIRGEAENKGVVGYTYGTYGKGVYGEAVGGEGVGVWGVSRGLTHGIGVHGDGTDIGVQGSCAGEYGTGVMGYAYGAEGFGVQALNVAGTGLLAEGGSDGHAAEFLGDVYAVARTTDAEPCAAEFRNNYTDGDGIRAYANVSLGNIWGALYAINDGTSPAIYAHSSSGPAAYLAGDVTVTGYLDKLGGGFKIDHPLDPENKYLYHNFVESPEMNNVYDGVVTLDENGEAWVQLAEWFGTLNRDFRYQLTAIGASSPNLYVAEKISDNRFKIAGGKPGIEVCWQVTGIRHDRWADANRKPVEVDKNDDERGTYLAPEAYGMPKEMRTGFDAMQQKLCGSAVRDADTHER